MNTYDKQSIEFLQKEFKERWNIELHPTVDDFDTKDVYYQVGDEKHFAEVKARRVRKTAYPDTVIELSKWNALKECKGGLIILFTDCWVVYSWNDLRKSVLYADQRYARHTTDFDDQRWILKTFVHIDLNGGTTYDYDRAI